MKNKEIPAHPNFQLKLEIDDDVYQKVMHWINKSHNEVSGLGKVVYDENNSTLRVVEALLLDQVNTAVTTEIDSTAITKAMYELRDTEGTLNWWWHSHVQMDVFWSSTDHAAIQSLGQQGWFISTVFNQREEMRSAYYQRLPIQVFVDDIETYIVRDLDLKLIKAWDKEYADKVREKSMLKSFSHDQILLGRSSNLVSPEEFLDQELAAWDVELDALEDSGLFPKVLGSKTKQKKRKGG